jgi:hypothetical protein
LFSNFSRHSSILWSGLIALSLLLPYPTSVSAQAVTESSAVAQSSLAAATQIKSGPWGNLLRIPIFLEAPTSMVETYPLPNTTPRWSFPESEAPRLGALFATLGLSSTLVQTLSEPSLQIREGGWIHFFPPAAAVESLSPEVRARLYIQLGKYPVNEFHQDPVLILSDTIDEWYKSSPLRRELVEKIKDLAYRRGEAWAFSDLPILLSYSENETEARAIFKAFTRTRTYLVRLNVTPDLDVIGVREYWSIGGRSFRLKSLEPLLASIQETGRPVELDISHIIPALPRKLIYNYPGSQTAAKGIMPDCHWTSLNFFNYAPHEYLLDPRLATNRVLEDYVPVSPPYTYGDILFFLRAADGDAFHSCLYLADDLVFTKNGRNQLSPWIISTIEDVSRVYLSITEGRIQAYRRKDQFTEATE